MSAMYCRSAAPFWRCSNVSLFNKFMALVILPCKAEKHATCTNQRDVDMEKDAKWKTNPKA